MRHGFARATATVQNSSVGGEELEEILDVLLEAGVVAEGFFVLEAFLVEDFGGGVRVAHGRSLSLCQNGEPVSRNNGIGNSICAFGKRKATVRWGAVLVHLFALPCVF